MGKRQNGEGTIYQRSDGLWIAEITLGYKEDGKRIKKRLSSKNLDELKKKLNDNRYYNDRSMVSAPTDYTVGSWLDFWLETYKKHSVKSTTYDMYYNVINTHLKPNIGKYKIDAVTPILVQKMINNLSENGSADNKGLSSSSVKKILITLSQAYAMAISSGLLYNNPCKDIIIPKKEPKKAVAFTADEQERFLSFCKDNTTYQNLFVFAFNTGMRMGELLALTWDDYDKDKNMIRVNKNLSVVRDYSDNDNKQKTIINSTKTESGTRDIPLTKTAVNVINEQFKKCGDKSVFVFCSDAGTPLMKRNIYRAFNNIIEKAEIQSPVTFHSFRHSFATRLLEKGADIKTVSNLLGHKSIQITLDIYSHVSSDLKQKTISLLE